MLEIGLIASIMALSWYFLVPLVLGTLFLVGCIWNEEGTWASVTLGVIIGFLVYMIPGFGASLIANPMTILSGILIYIAIGVSWSFFKWIKFLIGERDSYDGYDRKNIKIPQASNYKSTIIFWTAYWPISVIRYVLGSLLEDLFTFVWKRFSSLYQRVADKIFADLVNKKPSED